jgi:hypothetical protein
VVDAFVRDLDAELSARYAAGVDGRIPAERVLCASLLPVVYSVRSDLLMEQMN